MACLAKDTAGTVGLIFALALLPLVTLAGAALDYGRATSAKSALQLALDGAVLAGAKDGTSNWPDVALRTFNTNVPSGISAPPPSFSRDENQMVYSGTTTALVPTSLMNVVGAKEIAIGALSKVSAATPDDSCILTLDTGQALSDESLTFNGAPNVAMTGCTIRSNTSMKCNGHSTGAKAAIAAGSVTGCPNARSGAPVVPDIHAPLGGNITTNCTSSPGATWVPGSLPPMLVILTKSTHIEYHVCGNLTLSGNGLLTGNPPNTDSVIVIENGSLILDKNASISLSRVAIVFTGDNSKGSSIQFPNGKGNGATLSLSPPTRSDNPWRGVSVYQDPKLTNQVDNDWGPGATFNVDGLVYLPNSRAKMHGNNSSNSPLCAKFVFKSFVSNGSVNLNQSPQGCAALGVKQWNGGDPRFVS
jgi:hypothetical protein